MKRFLLIGILFAWPLLAEVSLSEQLPKAKPGDYMITAQGKSYTALIVRDKNEASLTIEEISLPGTHFREVQGNWRRWLESRAPGNSSWLQHQIALPAGTIQKTYSETRKEWVSVPKTESFLSTLMSLKLNPIPGHQRRRIGPPPDAKNSLDWRRVWQPPMIIDGQEVKGIFFNAYQTRWPQDGSELAGKAIEVFVPEDHEDYPSYFPYWIQISNGLGKARLRVVDAGRGLKR